VGERAILEKYLNSASKNTPETEIFYHGTICLLTSGEASKHTHTHTHNEISEA
jgi:hypothetical protein